MERGNRTPARKALGRATTVLLLAYPVLAIAAALTHRAVFSVAILLLLVTMSMASRMLAGSLWAWLGWLVGVVLVLALAAAGLTQALLGIVPLLVLLGLSWWFGRTLRAGREPLVERFIRVLEGGQRLALPGVRRYARLVTTFWAGLLAVQALILAALLLRGLVAPLPRWALLYQHVGGYLLIGLAFVLEYLYRRWHLRHVGHTRLHVHVLRVARRWPQLMHGREEGTP